jgi:hypothetical protein
MRAIQADVRLALESGHPSAADNVSFVPDAEVAIHAE